MTEAKTPLDALDEQERELARVLRALPGGEPPAALDQKILRAAANAAASSRRPRSRWLASVGSLWGIGGAAAAVLALGVTWQMIDPTRPGSFERSAPVPAAASAEDSAVSVDLGQAQTTLDSAETDAVAPARAPLSDGAASPVQLNAEPSFRADVRDASPAPAAPMPAPVMAAAPPPPRQTAAQEGDPVPLAPVTVTGSAVNAIDVASIESTTVLASEQAAKFSAVQDSARARSEKAAGELASTKASEAGTGAMTPAAWLAKVRNLRSQGRLGEARNSLGLFHLYYPQ